ncbi:hypothetical protein GOP47_0021445 [Adiantum capillus-veneris]|uniref:Uncharacterized protein n=1 Tax=Adiantum capillus-veneris TaxID=13818 RepID=A0A9D4U8E3_ADICA|nr:hypothetical protein GOP47_0021445 [Adiantum capillus-veneris]
MSSLAAARADNFYYPPEWTSQQGLLNKIQGQHPLHKRAKKLDQDILTTSFEMPYNLYEASWKLLLHKDMELLNENSLLQCLQHLLASCSDKQFELWNKKSKKGQELHAFDNAVTIQERQARLKLISKCDHLEGSFIASKSSQHNTLHYGLVTLRVQWCYGLVPSAMPLDSYESVFACLTNIIFRIPPALLPWKFFVGFLNLL